MLDSSFSSLAFHNPAEALSKPWMEPDQEGLIKYIPPCILPYPDSICSLASPSISQRCYEAHSRIWIWQHVLCLFLSPECSFCCHSQFLSSCCREGETSHLQSAKKSGTHRFVNSLLYQPPCYVFFHLVWWCLEENPFNALSFDFVVD